MGEGDWNILAWAARHRVAVVVGMIALFAWGVYGCWSFITDELPRCDPWQKWLIWIGDSAALLAAVGWMFQKTSVEPKDVIDLRGTTVKRVSAIMAIMIIADAAVTGYGVWNEQQSFSRAIPVTAIVTDSSTRIFQLMEPWRFRLLGVR